MTCELFCECLFTCNRELCRNNPLLCARRRVAMTLGRENVPGDLLPSQSDRVLDIIFAAIKKGKAA